MFPSVVYSNSHHLTEDRDELCLRITGTRCLEAAGALIIEFPRVRLETPLEEVLAPSRERRAQVIINDQSAEVAFAEGRARA